MFFKWVETTKWVFPKIGVPPNHAFNSVFHYKASILGCFPIFGNTQIRKTSKKPKDPLIHGWLFLCKELEADLLPEMPLAPPEIDVESEVVSTSSGPVSQAQLGWPKGWMSDVYHVLHQRDPPSRSLVDDLRI